MLFHASIPARDPARVADFLAGLWGTQAMEFPPCPGSWIAFADDGAGTAIEVYPSGTVIEAGPRHAEFVRDGSRGAHTATHIAIGSVMAEADIHLLAGRNGWESRLCRRGDPEPNRGFSLIEVWIEGSFMVEVLTDRMAAEYRTVMNSATWRAALPALRAYAGRTYALAAAAV